MIDFFRGHKGEILKLFFKNPREELYLREIAREFKKEPSSLQKALDSLVSSGIMRDRRRGNLRLFSLNEKYVLYKDLKNIISKSR